MRKNTKTATKLSLLLLPLVLASCGWGAQKPRTAEANRSSQTRFDSKKTMRAQRPSKYETRSLAEIQQLIDEGKAKQIDGTENAALTAQQKAQFQKDLTRIAQEDPELARKLAAAPESTNPDLTTFFEIKDNTGQIKVVSLQGKEQVAREFVNASDAAQDVKQQQATYRMIYQASPADVRAKLPSPDALNAQSVEQLQAQLNTAEALLQKYQAQHPTPVKVDVLKTQLSAQGEGPGTASDITGVCNNYSDNGLIKNFAFPMREFLTPVKDQGHRGICWAFAAMSAMEAVERVVSDQEYNLSEQYFNAVMKQDIGNDVKRQGGNVMLSLNTFTYNKIPIPLESQWTYNGARKWRNNVSFEGICNDYDGWCSETASQFPIVCDPTGAYCAEQNLNLPGIPARNTSMVWYKSRTKPVPIATLKTLLDNGTPLVYAYDVYWDAMDDQDGFVQDPQPESEAAGGHAVVIVGYVDAKDVETVLPNAPKDDEGYFIVKNSWGCNWGDSGYFYMPYSYVAKAGHNISIINDNNERSERWKTKDTKLKVTPSSKEIAVNDTADFTLLREIDNQPSKLTATWTVSDPTIAEIVSTGSNHVQVKGLKDGQVQVVATTDAGQFSATLTVTNSKLILTPATKEIEINEAAEFALLREADNQPAKVTATWTVSDPAIAEIISNGDNVVQVKGLKDGQVQVVATTDAAQYTATLTVKNSKVILTPATKEIEINEAAEFALLQEVDNQPSKLSATWTVSDPAIAEIIGTSGHTAQVKGIKDGTVQVIATTEKGQYSATLTVKAPLPQAQPCQVERVKLSSTRENLKIGQSLQLVATAEVGPAGCVGTPDLTVQWHSENARRATVDANGVVTGVTSGYAPVTATIGGKTATTLVVVSR